MYFMFWIYKLNLILCGSNSNIPFPDCDETSSVSINQDFDSELNTISNEEKAVGFFPNSKEIVKSRDIANDISNDSILDNLHIPLESIEKKLFRLWQMKNNLKPESVLTEREMEETLFNTIEDFNLYNYSIFQAKNQKLRMRNSTIYNKEFTSENGGFLVYNEQIYENPPFYVCDESSFLNLEFQMYENRSFLEIPSVLKDTSKTNFIDNLNTENVPDATKIQENHIKAISDIKPTLPIDYSVVGSDEIKNFIVNIKYVRIAYMRIASEKIICHSGSIRPIFKVFKLHTPNNTIITKLDVNEPDVLINKESKVIKFSSPFRNKYFHCLFLNDYKLNDGSGLVKLNDYNKYRSKGYINRIKENFQHIFDVKDKKNKPNNGSMIKINILVSYSGNDISDTKFNTTKTTIKFFADFISTKTEIVSVLCKMFNLKVQESPDEDLKNNYNVYFNIKESPGYFQHYTKYSHWIYDRFCLLEINGKILNTE